jgi:cell division inhibitor SulA
MNDEISKIIGRACLRLESRLPEETAILIAVTAPMPNGEYVTRYCYNADNSVVIAWLNEVTRELEERIKDGPDDEAPPEDV